MTTTMTRVGFVNKYEDRAVAVHELIDGRPACGARVDLAALESYEAPRGDVTCQRCQARRAAR